MHYYGKQTCFQALKYQPVASDAISLPAGTAGQAAECWCELYDPVRYQLLHEPLSADYLAFHSLHRL